MTRFYAFPDLLRLFIPSEDLKIIFALVYLSGRSVSQVRQLEWVTVLNLIDMMSYPIISVTFSCLEVLYEVLKNVQSSRF